MAVLLKIDLEHGNLSQIYANAKDTIKYLNDVVTYIEKNILEGGLIVSGLKVVEKKTRKITEFGYKQLESLYGKDFVTETKVSKIGITALEKKLDREEIARLETNGGIIFEVREAIAIDEDDVDNL